MKRPLWLPNGLEMSRPASSGILLDEPRPQLAGSAPSSCWAAGKLDHLPRLTAPRGLWQANGGVQSSNIPNYETRQTRKGMNILVRFIYS